MAKLTDTQLVVLSRAAQRDDGAAVLPDRMGAAAARKVAESLISRKLMREVRSKQGMPVWRKDEDDRPMSLVILRAGRDSIGVDAQPNVQKPATTAIRGFTPSASTKPARPNPAAKAGSKQALVISMLSQEPGVTLDDLIEATGWLPHTTRAAMTGLRKRGFSVERTRDGAEGSRYRIVRQATA